jgi:hypothetical protein
MSYTINLYLLDFWKFINSKKEVFHELQKSSNSPKITSPKENDQENDKKSDMPK